MTPAAAPPAPQARTPKPGTGSAGRLLGTAAILVAFYVAYSGVRMLEDNKDTTRALIRFVLATIVLCRGRHAGAGAVPTSSKARPSVAGVLRIMADRVVVGRADRRHGLGIAFRLHELRSQPYGIWFDEANGIVARSILDECASIFVGGATQLPALVFRVRRRTRAVRRQHHVAARGSDDAGVLNIAPSTCWRASCSIIAQGARRVLPRGHALARELQPLAMNGIFASVYGGDLYFLVRGEGQGHLELPPPVMAAIGLQTYLFALVPGIVALPAPPCDFRVSCPGVNC